MEVHLVKAGPHADRPLMNDDCPGHKGARRDPASLVVEYLLELVFSPVVDQLQLPSAVFSRCDRADIAESIASGPGDARHGEDLGVVTGMGVASRLIWNVRHRQRHGHHGHDNEEGEGDLHG